LGPFEIINVMGESKAAFELRLPFHWRIYPVFHGSLLELYRANKIEGRKQLNLSPPEIVNGELEYEVEGILDSRIQRSKLQYLVEWKGYGPEERTWEPVENLENAKEAIAAFHRRHPNRPAATDLTNLELRRSSVHRRGGTVINDSQAISVVRPTGSKPVRDQMGQSWNQGNTRQDKVRPGATLVQTCPTWGDTWMNHVPPDVPLGRTMSDRLWREVVERGCRERLRRGVGPGMVQSG